MGGRKSRGVEMEGVKRRGGSEGACHRRRRQYEIRTGFVSPTGTKISLELYILKIDFSIGG